MNQKNIIIGITIFSVLFFLSYLFIYFIPASSICQTPEGEQMDECILKNIESNTIKICNKLKSNSLMENCRLFFKEKAIKEKDISICLSDDGCSFNYALHFNNPDSCQYLEGQNRENNNRRFCYTYLSIALNDSTICQENECMITDPNQFKETKCKGKLTKKMKAYCDIVTAVENKEITNCPTETILDPLNNLTIDSNSVCIFSFALRYSDPSYCDNLLDSPRYPIFVCKYFVSHDPSFCSGKQTSEGNTLNCLNKCNNHEFPELFDACTKLYDSNQFKEKRYTAILLDQFIT